MTKKLLLFILLAFLAPIATSNADAAKNSDNDLVWICMGEDVPTHIIATETAQGLTGASPR